MGWAAVGASSELKLLCDSKALTGDDGAVSDGCIVVQVLLGPSQIGVTSHATHACNVYIK